MRDVDGDEPDDHADALDQAGVWRLATAYLARYAASSLRLRRVLERQIRRWHERRDLPPPDRAAVGIAVEAAVGRAVDLGLIDDRAFGLARARRFAGKGLPAAEVRRRLRSEQLDAGPDTIDAVLDGGDVSQAHRFARRKRLGPYRTASRAAYRDKDLHRLQRAGFAFRDAVAVVDGPVEGEPD